MENKNITINISTATLLKAIGIILALAIFWFIRDIILIVFISIIMAAVIEPSVNNLEKRRIPRWLSVIFIYIILFLLFALTVRMIIPPIIEQISILSKNFPAIWERVVQNLDYLRDFSEERGLSNQVQQGLNGLQSIFEKTASGVYSSVIVIFHSIFNLLVVMAITFYLVVQKEAVGQLFKALAPVKYHKHFSELFFKIQNKFGEWIKGELTLCVIVGIFTFIGLLFILPKYALVLALLAGITELVPYIGPILAAIPAVFLGFATPPFSIWRGLAVLILYIIIQQTEEKVIVPKVFEKKVGLNPVITIIIMLIGFKLAGIVGIILAIPVATAIEILIKDYIGKKYSDGSSKLSAQESEFENNSEVR